MSSRWPPTPPPTAARRPRPRTGVGSPTRPALMVREPTPRRARSPRAGLGGVGQAAVRRSGHVGAAGSRGGGPSRSCRLSHSDGPHGEDAELRGNGRTRNSTRIGPRRDRAPGRVERPTPTYIPPGVMADARSGGLPPDPSNDGDRKARPGRVDGGRGRRHYLAIERPANRQGSRLSGWVISPANSRETPPDVLAGSRVAPAWRSWRPRRAASWAGSRTGLYRLWVLWTGT